MQKIKNVQDIKATDTAWFEETTHTESKLDMLASTLKEIHNDVATMIGYDKIGARKLDQHIKSLSPFYQDSVIMPMKAIKGKFAKAKALSNFAFEEQKALTALYKKL